MKTKEITVTTGKGTKVELTFELELKVFHDKGDAWEGTRKEDSIIEKKRIVIKFKDKELHVDDLKLYKGYLVNLDAFDVGEQKRTKFAIDNITENEIKAIWAELKAAEMTPETEAIEAAEAAAEKAADIEIAKVIAAIPADRVFADKAAEYKWRKRYNAIHNDGGDGYIPDTTTVAEANKMRIVTKKDFKAVAQDSKSLLKRGDMFEIEDDGKLYRAEFYLSPNPLRPLGFEVVLAYDSDIEIKTPTGWEVVEFNDADAANSFIDSITPQLIKDEMPDDVNQVFCLFEAFVLGLSQQKRYVSDDTEFLAYIRQNGLLETDINKQVKILGPEKHRNLDVRFALTEIATGKYERWWNLPEKYSYIETGMYKRYKPMP
jgi:hypothetical protein